MVMPVAAGVGELGEKQRVVVIKARVRTKLTMRMLSVCSFGIFVPPKVEADS